MSTETVTTSVESTVADKSIKAGRFGGALARFQVAAFGDLVYGGIDRRVAHKIAGDFGSDLGHLMKTDADFAAKIGKSDKNGNSKITLSGGGKVKNTYAMALIRLCQQVDALYREGLITSRDIDCLTLTEKLQQYHDEAVEWADGQTWAAE